MCNSSPSDYYLFPALKQNLGGQKFKDDHEAENSCDTMTDTTGHGLLSTGNREVPHTIDQFLSFG
jgi:hypothetical protein